MVSKHVHLHVCGGTSVDVVASHLHLHVSDEIGAVNKCLLT
jgi:hypothetical protein